MPDMEAFGAAPMLDLKEALYWFTRSFLLLQGCMVRRMSSVL